MKKIKILPSILMLTLCVAILGVGVFAVAPTQNTIQGAITLDVVNMPLKIRCYLDTTEEQNLQKSFNEVRTGIKWTDGIQDLRFDLSSANTIEDVPERKLIVQIENPTNNILVAYFTKNGEEVTTDILKSETSIDVANVTLDDSTILNSESTIEMTIVLKASSFLTGTAQTASINYGLVVEEPVVVTQEQASTTTNKVVALPALSSGKTSLTLEDLEVYNSNPNIEILILPEGISTVDGVWDESAQTYVSLFVGYKSVVFPKSLTRIGDEAFYGCSFEYLVIPDWINSIGATAFGGCNIENLEILGRINAEQNIFYSSTNLKTVKYYQEGNGYIFKDGTLTFTEYEEKMNDDNYWGGNRNNYLPALVLEVEWTQEGILTQPELLGFSECVNLKNIVIPNGITAISNYAFENCGQLTHIEIPSSVTNIGSNAFKNCNGLTFIKIKSGLDLDTAYSLPTISKYGYTFNGWYTTADASGTKVTAISDNPDDYKTDVTYYAVFTNNTYTVTFNLNGGNIDGDTTNPTKTGEYNTDLGELPTPTRDGHTFIGWATYSLATSASITSATKITSTKTYYAVWATNG